MGKSLKNGVINTIKSKYVAIGTADISMWTNGEPFIIALDTEQDFEDNGFDFDNYKDMKVGDIKDSCSMEEGILVIRIR